MRLAAGGTLLLQGIAAFTAGLAPSSVVLHIASSVMGVLLILGLWTPIAGVLAAIHAMLQAFLDPGDTGFYVLLATLSAALALLGPGAWSFDARLFGWRRLEVRSNDNARGPESRV